MHGIFIILVPLSLAAVALTLGAGIYSMMRGGEYALKWSNKLMRLRVGLQAVAILIIVAAIASRGH
ncbi:MAG: twin transmembrane helix small protein [Caulobacteraceae bacterium]